MQQQRNPSSSFTPLHTQSIQETLRDFDWLAYMRTNHPVSYYEPMNLWQVFRYDDVQHVITDHNSFSSENVPNFSENIFLRDSMVAQDPPNHRNLHNLVNQAFTLRAINHLADDITHITRELLDKVLPQGKMDVVSDFAFPLTTKVIAVLLGVPDKDWDLFLRWAGGSDDNPLPQKPKNAMQALNLVGQQMYDYFSQLLAERRREPREDLITALSTAEVNGKRLSEDDLVKFCLLLLAAGQETMKHLLTNAIYCFTQYPESYNHLIQHPELIPTAIEEVLRYLPPFWFTIRRTVVDVELAGQHIPANTIIQAWNASANRDSSHFSDPERFDIQREPNHHLTFGHGIHFCIGRPLARLEARIVLSMMLKQLKNLRCVPNVPIGISPGLAYIIHALPVMFDG
jgi:cytochrome P450 family 109